MGRGRGQVLEGGHGQVDALGQESLLDLLGEEALALELVEGEVLHPISLCADDLDPRLASGLRDPGRDPAALGQGDSAPYTIVLADAGGNGISGQTVDITSTSGNGLASATLTTDISGQAQVVVTASAAGADTLTATALGISATQDLLVSDDSYAMTAPLSGDEILLNTVVPVSLTWAIGGVPQAGQSISFSATPAPSVIARYA